MNERPAWFSRLDLSCCEDYFKEVEQFAIESGRHEQFMGRLEYLCQGERPDDELGFWGKPMKSLRLRLFKDFAPKSFEFVLEGMPKGSEEWCRAMNGGIIFHGAHDRGGDGGAPTYSVNLTPQDGWSIHT